MTPNPIGPPNTSTTIPTQPTPEKATLSPKQKKKADKEARVAREQLAKDKRELRDQKLADKVVVVKKGE